MMSKRELQIQAENLLNNNSQEEALVICRKLWDDFPQNETDSFNLYDARLTLKAVKNNYKADFNFVYEVSKMFSSDFQIKNSFSWFVFHKYIKGCSNNDIIQYENVIFKLIEIASQKNLRTDDSFPCPVTIAVLNLVKAYSKGLFNASKILEWLGKLNPEFLSKKENIIPNTERGDINDASDLEKYYSWITKALIKQERYIECEEKCKKALEELKNFHYDNSLWLHMRIAICEEHLGNIDKSEHMFQDILNTKAGSDKWFIYKEIALLYFEKGDYDNAWSYSVDSAFYGNEPEYMIGLFLLQARVLVKLNRVNESKILAKLIGAIIKEKGWNNKQEYNRLLEYHKVDIANLESAISLFRQAREFWVSERYKGLIEEKGKIVFIHPRGKMGKIKTENNNTYNFHKRDFQKRQRNLEELKEAEVSFIKMNSFDGKLIAENIKVLKMVKSSISEKFKVGTIITGTVKNIADFGIFVRLTGPKTGLLHKNGLPNHLKSSFNEAFTSGQKIKVKIIKVTDKGPQLKLQE
ncbi:S1 RNA-binding domain-containing protein [uncultured Lutibacter sp.]|uniref:S1 RNA-binding domain-containing protein n=1 Tax=uncultured Lutibacter sp. TaxID=437739 RepID=UPI00260FFF3E|nr:S1 RNA-binding domain-containing protein [uncultured Lutibacter sp.]